MKTICLLIVVWLLLSVRSATSELLDELADFQAGPNGLEICVRRVEKRE